MTKTEKALAILEHVEPADLPTIAARAFEEFMSRGEAQGSIATAFLDRMRDSIGDEMGNQGEFDAALEDFQPTDA